MARHTRTVKEALAPYRLRGVDRCAWGECKNDTQTVVHGFRVCQKHRQHGMDHGPLIAWVYCTKG